MEEIFVKMVAGGVGLLFVLIGIQMRIIWEMKSSMTDFVKNEGARAGRLEIRFEKLATEVDVLRKLVLGDDSQGSIYQKIEDLTKIVADVNVSQRSLAANQEHLEASVKRVANRIGMDT